MSLNCNCN